MPLRCAFLLLQLATLLAFNTATATASGTATTASPKLRLFTAFSPTPTTDGSAPAPNATGVVNSSMALAMLDAAPVKQFASDFILIGEFLHAPAQMQVEGYDATNNAQILYQRSRWRLIQEGSDYETVPLMWARFEAVDDANATTCLGVAQWNASWNTDNAGETSDQHPASLLASVDASCKPSDVVALALTSPAGNATLAHLEAAGASNTAASKRMVEAARLLHQQQYVSSGVAILDIPSSASSRLFLRMHDSMCADRAATLSGLKGGAVAWSALALELCNGTGCSICKPAAFTTASDENESRTSSDSGSKHTLVILLSCGLFLAASVPVVLVLFRHQFFSPAANTKEENELTTNLAYVLRI